MNSTEFQSALSAVFIPGEWLQNWMTVPSEKRDILLKKFLSNLEFSTISKKVYTNANATNAWKEICKSENLSLQIEFVSANDEIEFLKQIGALLPPSRSNDADWDEVYFHYYRGLLPLMERNILKKMEERHQSYFSQYSYSENLPAGLVPTFVSREFLASLPSSLPGSIHDYFLKNINHYDIDVYFQKPDLRQYRLDFSVSDSRSLQLCLGFLNLSPECNYEEILPTLQKHSQLFRYAPSYIEIELYRGCPSKCTFCPRQYGKLNFDDKAIEPSLVTNTIQTLATEFASPFSVCFGGLGEPVLHPQLESLIETTLATNYLQELFLETALHTNIESFLGILKSLKERFRHSESGKNHFEKLSLIINLSTLNPSLYSTLQGTETPLSRVLETLNQLSEIVSPKQIFVQMLKIKEVETEIDGFFSHFEKMGFQVILQKYNRYAGRMPEKRVSDLTPIHREFCWHLARDFYINADGSVSLCRQVPDQSIGNLNQDSAIEIWNRGQTSFLQSLLGKHSETGSPCLECDEWYTFQG